MTNYFYTTINPTPLLQEYLVMPQTLNPDPRLECRLRRDIAQPIIPRESTVTPVEYPLTAS